MERNNTAAALETMPRQTPAARRRAAAAAPARAPSPLGSRDCENSAPKAPLALRIAVRLALSAAVAAVAAYLFALIFDFHHKSYGDGPMLAMAERMRSEPISADWMREPPYTLSCYGPAFYYVANAAARLGGWEHSLVPGRLVALFAALVAAALAAIAAGRQTKSAEVGLLAALMFLVSLPVNEWVPYARVDTLAIAFAGAAYLAVGSNLRRLFLSAVCVAAGSLAKPTVALSAVPIFIHLLATRRYRDASLFATAVAALGASAWGAVQWASDGFFLTAVLEGNRNPMQLWRGYFFSYEFLYCPLGAVATVVAVRMLLVSPRRFAQSLYSVGYLSSLAISAVTVCKQGSELNYFLETALLGAVAIAVDGTPRVCKLGSRRCLVAMAAVGAVLAFPTAYQLRGLIRSPREAMPYEVVRECLAGEPDDIEVLADGRMIDLVLAAGRRPWLNDSYLYMLLVENGTLDSQPLVERLNDGRIKWLFLRKTLAEHIEAEERGTRCWPKEAIELFTSHYELLTKKDGLWAYRHRRYGADVASTQ